MRSRQEKAMPILWFRPIPDVVGLFQIDLNQGKVNSGQRKQWLAEMEDGGGISIGYGLQPV